MLAMVMGLSVVAFALIAVQRAGSTQRVDRPLTPPVSDPGEDDAELLKSGETARTTGTADLPAAGPDAPAPSDALAPSDAPGPPGTSEPGPDAAPATDGRAPAPPDGAVPGTPDPGTAGLPEPAAGTT
ncbi:hypothetical protein HCN52_02450 [Streptomyces bohaiensis]|uniref:Serine/threonine protein kinase n=1 Tax=Streptomyces bohaiensis TaxID=1431344 RepID=A0ABX1C702_9ACTN|nr:hypothetical protein [Streptomyces bohaiensis]